MTHAVQIDGFGGADVFRWASVKVGDPGPSEIRIGQTAVGLNFIDVYMRSGNHSVPFQFPAVLGVEAAGIVEEIGRDVTDIARGDRVAYFGILGAYTESRLVPAQGVFKIPREVDNRTAAALLAKGITAQYLCRDAYPVKKSEVVPIHAAAGGVGLVLSQWAAALGATVIGTVGSQQMVALATANGCRHVIVATEEDFVARVTAITQGRKADLVFDAPGKDTVLRSWDCLRPRGTLVSFGRTSGWPPPLNPADLMHKGSLLFTMTQLKDFTRDRAETASRIKDLFDAVVVGTIKPNIEQDYPLKNVAQAHRDLESRRTAGSTVLAV